MATPLLLLACAAAPVGTQQQFEEDFADLNKPWPEIAVGLPAAPLPENLLPLYVSANASQSFAVDAKSVTVGADGVIRYTMVAASPSGASNVGYEGIRCDTYEKKLYAIGQMDGSWTRSRRDQWERIVSNKANRQHAVLAREYLCDGKMIAGNAQAIVQRIRHERPIHGKTGD